MVSRRGFDFCMGCDEPEQKSLPDDWQVGQPIPDDITIHRSFSEWQPFVFIGDKMNQRRYYIPQPFAVEVVQPEKKSLFRTIADWCRNLLTVHKPYSNN